MFKTLFASTALLCLAIAAPAAADEWYGTRGESRIAVAGLDLTDAAVQASLYQRVYRASYRLCRAEYQGNMRAKCVRWTVENAISSASPRVQVALRNVNAVRLAQR